MEHGSLQLPVLQVSSLFKGRRFKVGCWALMRYRMEAFPAVQQRTGAQPLHSLEGCQVTLASAKG